MSDVDGKERMLKRHEIVVRIIEANSRRLHLENERNGLDIERRIAERDVSAAPDDDAIRARLATLQSKIAEAQAACLKLEAERDWLDQSLAAFDGTQSAHEPSGRA